MKLGAERLWWLKGFADRGWTLGRPNLVGVEKWDAHSTALVEMGLLEADEEFGTANHRITDAGRDALSASGDQP